MRTTRNFMRGFTLLEVLITLVILAFGILGLVNLQSKVHVVELESYQRAQAVLLLQDMVSRINANRLNADDYRTDDGDNPAYLGVGDGQPALCTDSPAVTGAACDQRQWTTSLKGAAEQKDLNNDGDFDDAGEQAFGAMTGARGCIELIQAEALATCTPGIYRVTVVWQGLNATAAPSLLCAQSINAYGGDSFRRAIAAQVTIGVPGCT